MNIKTAEKSESTKVSRMKGTAYKRELTSGYYYYGGRRRRSSPLAEAIKEKIKMVCIPCIIAPVLLFIWYKFIQPIMLKFWNPWAPTQSIKNSEKNTGQQADEKPAACPFANNKEMTEESCQKDAGDKKSD
ncbi:uncharacterized protein CDAR_562691 [Caerostris darwini]|uniref:Uncharacterized protein n=1 Tax=Caerostris darwini TaxID=1538125 RepID=A0AAV4X9X3_9ARAC|nr:uncharacterized protein CDAR_562691 [Caerostris darwini]